MHRPLLNNIYDNSVEYEDTSALPDISSTSHSSLSMGSDSNDNPGNNHNNPINHRYRDGSVWRPPTPPNGSSQTKFAKIINSIGESISAVIDSNDIHDEGQRTYYDESLLMDEEKGDLDEVRYDLSRRNHSIVRLPQRLGKSNNDYSAIPHNKDADRIRNECTLFYNEEDERHTTMKTDSLVQKQVKDMSLDSSISNSMSTIYDVPIMMKGKNGGKFFDSITINAEDFSSSSLYEKDLSGQVKYKLPTDNVRLVMLPNVQPGILSMVAGEESLTQSTANLTSTDALKDSNSQKTLWGSVSYVLTVEEDLYKRLVQEMADSLQSPFGLYNCCRESGTVDIRIALAILAVFFMFLFITTLVWPTN